MNVIKSSQQKIELNFQDFSEETYKENVQQETPINATKVRKTITQLKNEKACVPEIVNNELLKAAPDKLMEIL